MFIFVLELKKNIIDLYFAYLIYEEFDPGAPSEYP